MQIAVPVHKFELKPTSLSIEYDYNEFSSSVREAFLL